MSSVDNAAETGTTETFGEFQVYDASGYAVDYDLSYEKGQTLPSILAGTYGYYCISNPRKSCKI